MIGLKESYDYHNLCVNHTDIISKDVLRKVNFYLNFFKVKNEISRIKRLKDRDEYVKVNLEQKSGFGYKKVCSLLNCIKINNKIKRRSDYHKIGRDLTNEFKEEKKVIETLNFLNGNVKSILNFEFKQPFSQSYVQWRELKSSVLLSTEVINQIFSYNDFRDDKNISNWSAYDFTSAMKIKSCPYCNRLYTITIKKPSKTYTRPQLDHFIPRSQEPLLQLSFFNLIPSCSVCNGDLKGTKTIHYLKYLSPYEENLKHELMKFDYWPSDYLSSIGKSDKLNMIIKYNGNLNNMNLRKKVEGNIKLFELNKVYNNHADIVSEIIRKKYISSDKYLESLQNMFGELNLTKSEAYVLAFGNYWNESKFIQRPFSKMTKDFHEQLLKEFK